MAEWPQSVCELAPDFASGTLERGLVQSKYDEARSALAESVAASRDADAAASAARAEEIRRANLDYAPNPRLSLRTSIGLTREDNDRNENDNTIDGVATNALANQPTLGTFAA